MLSDLLTSQYLQYKTDTEIVATWLASTAKRCGLDVSEGDNNQGTGKRATGRLKGKARKTAKAPPKPIPANENSKIPKKSKYTITVKQFTSFAEHIAGYDNPPVGPVEVSRGFSLALDRAISARREFRKHGIEEEDEASQESHGFFVDVLERVRETLRPLIPKRQADTPAVEKDEKSLANRFEHLELEEQSEAFLNAPDAPKPAAPEKFTDPSAPDVKAEADLEAEVDLDRRETIFMFHLLVQDANAFMDIIEETWRGYKVGRVDLVSASMTTNTAIDLLRRMEEEMKPSLDKFGGGEKLIEAYYFARCRHFGEDPDYRERPSDGFNFKVYDQTQDIFISAWQLLRSFTAICDPHNSPFYKPGFYGTYDPESDRKSKPARERFAEDMQILMEAFPEFYLLGFRAQGNLAEDELSRGLKAAFTTKEHPFWLVFAVQVFLDIHHVLRDQVSRAFTELQRSAMTMVNSIGSTLKMHEKLRIENWPLENDMALRHLQAEMNYWCATDPLQIEKARLGRPTGEAFRLFKWHPLFCGLLLYRFKMVYQEAGITFAGAWGSVLYSLHLYNALRQEKLLTARWADLDMLQAIHPESWIGGPPRTPDDYIKRFSLSMGYSAANFAKNRRDQRPQASKNGPKSLTEQGSVALMFKERFCHGSKQTDMTRADLQTIVEKAQWGADTDGDRPYDMMKDVPGDIVRNPTQRGPIHESHESMSAETLLRKLRLALQGEGPEITFDYFVTHRTCWLLLTKIKMACADQLRVLFGTGCIEKENQLPWMIGYIFLAASGVDRAANLAPKKQPGKVTSQLMFTAANVLDSMLASGMGALTCRILRERHDIHISEDSDSE
ncbi:hypothetical protein PEX1_043610 [Penicillium expansum]|nr:hypothetical protein PEX1_043610 [Penicillium expansum]